MFLKPSFFCESGDKLFDFKDKILRCSSVIPDEIRLRAEATGGYRAGSESYIIEAGEECTAYATGEAGLRYARSTFELLAQEGERRAYFLCDHPDMETRGYRVYLPGASRIGEFKQVIDLVSSYRYNTMVWEIGGAMEYKRHPEINEAWVKYCASFREYSGKTHEIQHRTYSWEKNSIHVDNGDGSFLTQAQIKDLLDYAHSRGISVIPEVPSYSHSDYLLLCRPDLREMSADEHADTYCPSNPGSYELLFEIIDEVCELFKPEYVHIGHDELYLAGICPKCRASGKKPYELYVDDITKIHDYLASKGVKTLMWGEKLLNAYMEDGHPIGGSEGKGKDYIIPALFECADKLPRDISLLHWYWAFDEKLDDVYHKNGYRTLFGNMRASTLKNWRKRVDKGIKGGFVSNWGSFESEYMQRNIQTAELIFSSYAMWCGDYDDSKRLEVWERTIDEYFSMQKGDIEILHTTDGTRLCKTYYDGIFISDDEMTLGHYVLSYADGSEAFLPVKYGCNICNMDMLYSPDNRGLCEAIGASRPVKLPTGSHMAVVCECDYDGLLPTPCGEEVSYKVWYKCRFENPQLGKKINGIKYEPVNGSTDNIYIKSIKFN